MDYRIDRQALDEFIGRQIELVESASIPKLLGDVVELRLRHESLSRGEVHARSRVARSPLRSLAIVGDRWAAKPAAQVRPWVT